MLALTPDLLIEACDPATDAAALAAAAAAAAVVALAVAAVAVAGKRHADLPPYLHAAPCWHPFRWVGSGHGCPYAA